MTLYVKITDGNPLRYSLDELRADNPNTSFPEQPSAQLLAGFSVFECGRLPKPAFDPFVEQLIDGTFSQDASGSWWLAYSVQKLPREQAEDSVRGVRGARLAVSDWTQLADAPVDRTVWAAYRAELRAVPEQSGFPYSVVWPIEPA